MSAIRINTPGTRPVLVDPLDRSLIATIRVEPPVVAGAPSVVVTDGLGERPERAARLCGRWMIIARTECARRKGHLGACSSAAMLARRAALAKGS